MLKTTIAPHRSATAVAFSNQEPANRTSRQVPLKIAPVSERARSRRRPSTAFAIGSCATTSTIVFTKKMTPIPASLTEALSFTKGGSVVEIWAYAAATRSAVSASSQTKGRSLRTSE